MTLGLLDANLRHIVFPGHAMPYLGLGMLLLVLYIVRCLSRSAAQADTLGAQLLENERLSSETESSFGYGSFDMDVPTGRVWWSEGMMRLLGYTPETFGENPKDVAFYLKHMPETDREETRKVISDWLQRKHFETYEKRMVTADGREIWVRVQGKYTNDERLRLIGTLNDISQERQTLDRLVRNEQLLSEAEIMTHTGSWEWNPASDKNYWSAGMYHVYGLEPTDKPLGLKEAMQMAHPDDAQYLRQTIEAAIAEKQAFSLAYRHLTPDGKEKTIHIASYPVFDSAGVLANYRGRCTDVTEQHRLSESLRRSEALLSQNELTYGYGSFEWDAQTDRLYWSAGTLALFDLPPDTDQSMLTAEQGYAMVHPQDQAFSVEIVQNAIRQRQPYTVDYRVNRTADQPVRWLRTKGVPEYDSDDGLVRVYGTVTDVTEEKRAWRQLKRNQALLEEAEKLLVQGSWSWRVADRRVYWSVGMWNMLGYEAHERAETVPDDFYMKHMHPEDLPTAEASRAEYLDTGGSGLNAEHRLIRRDGTVITVTSQSRLIEQDNEGKPLLVVGVTADVTERRNTQNNLQQQADLLRNILDNSQTGIYRLQPVCDPQGGVVNFRFMQVNRTLTDLLGCQPSDLEGTLLTERFAATATNGMLDLYRDVWQAGQDRRVEFFYKGDDINAWYDVMVRPYGGELLVTFLDISRRKQYEQAMERQTENYRSILDASLNAIVSMRAIRQPTSDSDIPGPVVDFMMETVNHAMFAMTGRHAEEVQGTTLLTSFPGNLESGFFDVYVRVVETGHSERFTEYYQDTNGLRAWYEVQAVRQGTDTVVLTFQDVSELKNYQAKLEGQAKLLRAVLDNSATGIVLYKAVRNDKGQITDFTHQLSNSTNNQVTGRIDLEGTPWLADYPENARNGLFDTFVRVTETGQSERLTFPYHAHGIKGWFEALFVKQDDGVLFTYLDITALKSYQQELEQANLELLRSNEELERFAYVASHDLSEPLRKINTFAKMLTDRYAVELAGEGQLFLERMTAAARRMQLLIQSLLDFSRIGRKETPFVAVDLNAVVADVVSDLEVAIANRKASVRVEPLPTLTAELTQMRQLFGNLISNALKFVREDVPPVVRVSAVPATPDDLRRTNLDPNKRFVRLSVADNGIGFEPEYAERIFVIFQRLHAQAEFEGAGIGLAVCRRIAENHGGAIYAEGTPGQGATFSVCSKRQVNGASVRLCRRLDQRPLVASQRLAKDETTLRRNM